MTKLDVFAEVTGGNSRGIVPGNYIYFITGPSEKPLCNNVGRNGKGLMPSAMFGSTGDTCSRATVRWLWEEPDIVFYVTGKLVSSAI